MRRLPLLSLLLCSSSWGAIEYRDPVNSGASLKPNAQAKLQPSPAKWLLPAFLKLSATNPKRLFRIADKLLSDERVRIASVEPSMAFEWQHRLAMVQALSE